MNLENLLERRHEARVEWIEPWKACGPEGNSLTAHVTISCTVHDAVNLQRSVAQQAGRPTMGQDIQHLADFMAVHWAKPVDDVRFVKLPNEPEKTPIIPGLVKAALALAMGAWIIALWLDNQSLVQGPPTHYKLEHLGYTSIGSDFRSTTDGWTSNVGSRASAIRQAWKHWKAGYEPKWEEAK